MSVEVLTQENFHEKISSAEVIVIVDFFADWCGPCKRIAPVLQQIAEENEGKLVVYKINIDDAAEIATKYNIKSIPCMISFKNGEVHKQVIGAVPKRDILAIADL